LPGGARRGVGVRGGKHDNLDDDHHVDRGHVDRHHGHDDHDDAHDDLLEARSVLSADRLCRSG
jgi:hypothetical protein